MVGRQLGIVPSQAPNWMATEPSVFFFAVTLLSGLFGNSRDS